MGTPYKINYLVVVQECRVRARHPKRARTITTCGVGPTADGHDSVDSGDRRSHESAMPASQRRFAQTHGRRSSRCEAPTRQPRGRDTRRCARRSWPVTPESGQHRRQVFGADVEVLAHPSQSMAVGTLRPPRSCCARCRTHRRRAPSRKPPCRRGFSATASLVVDAPYADSEDIGRATAIELDGSAQADIGFVRRTRLAASASARGPRETTLSPSCTRAVL